MGQACARVLILDHDPLTRDQAARIAENGGYLATEVAHAGEALDALASQPELKAIIAGNLWRGGIDGIALAGTVRCFWPEVAIILVVDRVLPSDADLPLDTMVLLRPFTPHELTSAISAALEARACEARAVGASAEAMIVAAQPLAH